MPKYANFIVRNADDQLKLFKNEPTKNEKQGYWEYKDGNLTEFGVKAHKPASDYKFVLWEDDYPTALNERVEGTYLTAEEASTNMATFFNQVSKDQEQAPSTIASVNRPNHYQTGEKDLFDEWYERYFHSKKTFTGREVFVIIMKVVAERYFRRYPKKNPEDLEKSIYTLERLKEYEDKHRQDEKESNHNAIANYYGGNNPND